MAFIASNGEEWIDEKTYEGFIHKKPRVRKQVYEFHSPFKKAIKGICGMCKRRKAVTIDYRDRNVCQNCNLEIIEKWKQKK